MGFFGAMNKRFGTYFELIFYSVDVTDYADVVTNHIVLFSPPIDGSPDDVIIVGGLGSSIELYGIGERHLSEGDFVFGDCKYQNG